MQRSETITKLTAALREVWKELTPINRTSENPFFHSMYADLTEVVETTRPLLLKHGLLIIQMPGFDGPSGKTTVETTLIHDSGEWVSGVLGLSAAKHDPQAETAAVTYARRTAWKAVLGMVEQDDDGNRAAGRDRKSQDEQANLYHDILRVYNDLGITQAQIETKLNCSFEKGLTQDHIDWLREIYKGVRAKELTIEEIFGTSTTAQTHHQPASKPTSQDRKRTAAAPSGPASGDKITEKQVKFFWVSVKKYGFRDENEIHEILSELGYEHVEDIPKKGLDQVLTHFDKLSRESSNY